MAHRSRWPQAHRDGCPVFAITRGTRVTYIPATTTRRCGLCGQFLGGIGIQLEAVRGRRRAPIPGQPR